MSKKSMKQYKEKFATPKKVVKNNKRKVAEWVLAILILIWTIGTVLGVVGFVRTLPKASAEESQSSMQLMNNKKSFTYPAEQAGGYFPLPFFDNIHFHYANSSATIDNYSDLGGLFAPYFQFYRTSTEIDSGYLGLRMQTNPYNSLYNSRMEIPFAIGESEDGAFNNYVSVHSYNWQGYDNTFLINFYGSGAIFNSDYDIYSVYPKSCTVLLSGDVLYGNSIFNNGATNRGIRYLIELADKETNDTVSTVAINICLFDIRRHAITTTSLANVANIIDTIYIDYVGASTPYQYPTSTSSSANVLIDSFTEDSYALGNVSNYAFWRSFDVLYEEAFQSGQSKGYDIGYDVGKSDGYGLGYNQGKADGFTDGVSSANEYSFAGLLGAVFDVPVQTFQGLFNFEILGVNLSGFFLALLTLMIILAITKLFI